VRNCWLPGSRGKRAACSASSRRRWPRDNSLATTGDSRRAGHWSKLRYYGCLGKRRMTARTISINRAPVLTLWAAVVAKAYRPQELAHSPQSAEPPMDES
jgi:hypothetical protein